MVDLHSKLPRVPTTPVVSPLGGGRVEPVVVLCKAARNRVWALILSGLKNNNKSKRTTKHFNTVYAYSWPFNRRYRLLRKFVQSMRCFRAKKELFISAAFKRFVWNPPRDLLKQVLHKKKERKKERLRKKASQQQIGSSVYRSVSLCL